MLKLLLLALLLLAAYGFVAILIRRLTDTQRQIGALRDQMARNDDHLARQMRDLNRQQRNASAREGEVFDSPTSSTHRKSGD